MTGGEGADRFIFDASVLADAPAGIFDHVLDYDQGNFGNYRLDECLKSLRTAVGEDADFAAGWSLLAYYATDSHEAADALAHAQSLVGKASSSEMLFVR